MYRMFVAVIGLLIIGCAAEQPSSSPAEGATARADIQKQSRAFSEAYMKGDVDTMMDIYTEDAVIFPGNSVAIEGDSLLRRYWTLPEGRVITNHRMTSTRIEIEGSMASDYGIYEVSGSNGSNDWGPTRGKYLVVWRLEEDGQWRMSLDMWNSLPSP